VAIFFLMEATGQLRIPGSRQKKKEIFVIRTIATDLFTALGPDDYG